MYDTSVRTQEEEKRHQERQQKLIAQMDELDFRPGEYKPDTTLDDSDMSTVIMGGSRRR